MPSSKHKNGKLIRELNSKIKRSKKTRASKLKLRNKCGGASGRSPDRKLSRFLPNRMAFRSRSRFKRNKVRPASRSASPSRPAKPAKPARSASRSPRSASRSPRSASRSPRSASRSPRSARPASPASRSSRSRSASNNYRNPEGFTTILQGPMAEHVLKYLNQKEIAYLKGVNTKIQKAVEKEMEHKNYTFLFNIYNDRQFKKVIKKIEQVDLTDTKNNYLQTTPDKLKEIQEVYKNNEIVHEKDRINDLIRIYYKYFNMFKMENKEDPTLDNYIKYLKQTSKKQFGEYSNDIEDIERGLAILTLFYGFSHIEIDSIIVSRIKNNPEMFLDYISLINQLFLNQDNITFRSNIGFEFTVRAVQTSKKFNKAGIDKYVELRKDGKKDHNQAVSELEGNPKFLRPKDN